MKCILLLCRIYLVSFIKIKFLVQNVLFYFKKQESRQLCSNLLCSDLISNDHIINFLKHKFEYSIFYDEEMNTAAIKSFSNKSANYCSG